VGEFAHVHERDEGRGEELVVVVVARRGQALLDGRRRLLLVVLAEARVVLGDAVDDGRRLVVLLFLHVRRELVHAFFDGDLRAQRGGDRREGGREREAL